MRQGIKKKRAEQFQMDRIQTAIALGVMSRTMKNDSANLNQTILKMDMEEPKTAVQAAFEKLKGK